MACSRWRRNDLEFRESQQCHKARRHRSVFYLNLSDSGAGTHKEDTRTWPYLHLWTHRSSAPTQKHNCYLDHSEYSTIQADRMCNFLLWELGLAITVSLETHEGKAVACQPKGWSLSLSGEVSSSDPLRVNPGEMASYLARDHRSERRVTLSHAKARGEIAL